jgi:hypothetical protein
MSEEGEPNFFVRWPDFHYVDSLVHSQLERRALQFCGAIALITLCQIGFLGSLVILPS